MAELNKKEAQAYLNISERTLERYVKKHKVAVRYENTEHGRAPFFPLKELERIKEERSPTYQGAITHESPIMPVQQPVYQLFADTEIMELSFKLTLNLSEAALISGIGRSRLLTAIKSRELNAIKFKGWRVRPQDLREYVDSLWENFEVLGGDRSLPSEK
ncbi:MAG: helix-turn-helix domain-containing protein [Nostoc sp. NMS7]|uniref:helix-turn-helix domain-containing protein n=1 Tax=Nostoc sp. NMS7 TaxID=2815391 RepID=UPI0025E6D4E0|nr:helix-turn-helix domain-containing protein [Nostoc sp. NMS7]MBN3949416.1 helix-turn-helix domain-containing protein [Nostoc sp. NMS7]